MKRTVNFSAPVVVFPSIHHGGLGITRSLGRLGVPVYNVAPDSFCPAFRSRWCRGRFLSPPDHVSAERSVEFLLTVADDIGGRPILLPTTDTAALLVADYAAVLSERFCFPRVPATLVRALYSKKEMHHLARRCGVPTPDACFPQCRPEALRFASDTRYPVVVKAIDDCILRNRGCVTKAIGRNRRELMEHYDRMEDAERPNLMFQEYIPDAEIWMFNGYFDGKSECQLGFTGKKIRQFPVYTGATSLGICLDNEAVAHTTQEFMKALGYRGILDIGYAYDARDGRHKLLDVNPRVGSTFRLFVGTNGMDVVRAMYFDMTGQPVVVSAAQAGRRWLVEDFDLLACLQYGCDGALNLRQWIRSYHGVQELACFASDDPLPLLPMLFDDTRRFVSRVLTCLPSRRSHNRADAARQPGPVKKDRQCAES